MVKRKIDRDLIAITLSAVGTTQQNVALVAAREGVNTIVRIVGALNLILGTNIGTWGLAIVHSRAGISLNTIDLTNAGTMYAPEYDVLWHKSGLMPAASVEPQGFEIDVRGMRILREGDQIQLVCRGSAADVFDLAGSTLTFRKLA